MGKNRFQFAVTLACAMALAGCGGGGGGGLVGEPLPPADNTVPGQYQALPGGIDDYYASVPGTWLVNLDNQVNHTVMGTAVLTDAMIYDSLLDQWTVNIDGTNFVLTDPDGLKFYQTDGCSTNCVFLQIFDDDPDVAQWGTFGYVNNWNFSNFADIRLPLFYTHYGLKTVNMPTGGSATYDNGSLFQFQGEVVRETAPDSFEIDNVTGSVKITAEFTATGGTVTFDSTGDGFADLGTSYTLTGTATISGNTYAGTVNGEYSLDGTNPTVIFDTSGSTLSGAFYGPNQTGQGETAGVVYSSDSTGTGEIVGGFWSPQTGATLP